MARRLGMSDMFFAEGSRGKWFVGRARWSKSAVTVLSFLVLWSTSRASGYDVVSAKAYLRALVSPNQVGIDDVTTISPGQRATRQIRGGEHQLFQIAAGVGQYLRVAVRPTRIILQVTLFDPSGKQIVTTNNPAGGSGPIFISEIAALSGDYKLEVRSIEAWANPGSFEVNVAELRASNPEDLRLVEAERWFAKGLQESERRAYQNAIETYKKALPYWKSIHHSHWEALTHYALGQTHYLKRNFIDSDKSYAQVLEITLDPDDWRIRAAALNDLGLNARIQGKNEIAISRLNEALRSFEEHADRRGQASSLNNLAAAYGQMGELRKALDLTQRALPLRLAENFQSGLNNLRNTLGNIYDRLGDPEKALEYHSQALVSWRQLAQAKQLDSPDRLGNALNSVALVSAKVGKWDEAAQYFDDALKVPDTSPSLRAAILNNRGEFYSSLGDFDTATQYLGEANTLLNSQKTPDPDLRASVLFQIGQIHLATGRLSDAIALFREAKLAKPNKPKLAYVLTALGDAWSRQGNFDEALKAYSEALEIQIQIEDRRGQALTRQKRGEAYALAQDSPSASTEYQTALSLWRAVKDQRGEAAALNSMALLERDRNNLRDSVRRNQEAIQILESLRTSVSSHQLRTSYFASHENYYKLNIDLNMLSSRTDQSRQQVAAAFAASERSRARSLIDTLLEVRLDLTENVSDDLVRLESEIERRLRAKLEAQTNLLRTRHIQSEAEAMAKEIAELIRQQSEVRGRIRASNPKYSALTQPQLLTTAEIQQQLDAETLLLEFALGDKRSYAWVVSADSIKGFELAPREQIEAVARRVTEALTAENRQEKNESVQEKRLRVDKADKDYVEASAALSKMIIEPVASLLGTKRLVIVADGALQTIPFGSLPIPTVAKTASAANTDAKVLKSDADRLTTNASAKSSLRVPVAPKLLILEHEIVYLPSASVLALHRRELATRKPAPYPVAVIADPVFDNQDDRVARAKGNSSQQRKDAAKIKPDTKASPKLNAQNSAVTADAAKDTSPIASALRDVGLDPTQPLPRLNHSREEATAILEAASSRQSLSALNFKASRETATSPELSKYRIIHFATHGILDLEHPELSGIALSMVDEKGQSRDGYLRLHEIYNLNLPAELVVLSACQTGVGKQIKGEGLIALTRGFMYAGAKSVVASLWKVDDAATAALMAEFYKQMFTNKLKPAAALREAQLKVSKVKRWQSPYYWSGFFLQGDWN